MFYIYSTILSNISMTFKTCATVHIYLDYKMSKETNLENVKSKLEEKDCYELEN